MKKNQKNRELVTAQLINQNVVIEGYCASNYSVQGSTTSCTGGYSCNNQGNSITSASEDDDILL